jgi:hypothetical protein
VCPPISDSWYFLQCSLSRILKARQSPNNIHEIPPPLNPQPPHANGANACQLLNWSWYPDDPDPDPTSVSPQSLGVRRVYMVYIVYTQSTYDSVQHNLTLSGRVQHRDFGDGNILYNQHRKSIRYVIKIFCIVPHYYYLCGDRMTKFHES